MPAGNSGTGARDVKGGGAYFTLWAKDGITGVLDSLKRRVGAFGSFMQRIGKASAVAGLSLAAPLAGLFKGGLDRAVEVNNLAREFKAPIEAMSRLKYAADAAGVSIQDVLEDTEGRFTDLIARAPVLDAATVKRAAEAQLAFTDATIALQNAMLPLLETITPVVKVLAEIVKRNSGLVITATAAAGALVAFGLAAAVTGPAVAATIAGVKLLAAGLALLLSPVGLVTAAVVGLGYLFLTETQAGKQAVADLGSVFRRLGETFKETWGGIGDAIKAGNLELAFEVAGAGVKVVWLDLLHSLKAEWEQFLNDLVGALRRNPALSKALTNALGGPIGPLMDLLGLTPDAERVASALSPDVGVAKQRLDQARAALAALTARAQAEAAAVPPPDRYNLPARAFDAVKGNFQTFGTARQQFGYANEAQKQTELLKALNDGKGELPVKIGAAVAAGFKLS